MFQSARPSPRAPGARSSDDGIVSRSSDAVGPPIVSTDSTSRARALFLTTTRSITQRIATLERSLADSHTDFNVVNGVTYFYAVDAFDHAGNESELSYENAFDTPRPEGFNVTVFSRQDGPGIAGLDFSDWDRNGFVTDWTANDVDVYFQRVGTVLFARGTVINNIWNDLQDLGFTETMDEVSWAPAEGWSVAPNGVELIEGHTYVVWTHDNFFAKFRVTQILGPALAPTGAVIDWAYQVDNGNPELVAGWGGKS